MSIENFPLIPDPKFISLLSEFLPHERSVTRYVSESIMEEEISKGTNFIDDVLIHYTNPNQDLSFERRYKVENSMWTPSYIDTVKLFVRDNNINERELANIWLLRCRIYFELKKHAIADWNRHNYDSEQQKRINTVKNQIIPFIKNLQGNTYFTGGGDHIQSILFKPSNPRVRTLKLTGHLANNMYSYLQEMAYTFLEANSSFITDLHTKRFKVGMKKVAIGSYKILLESSIFTPPLRKTPPVYQLTILKNLIELAFNREGFLEDYYTNSKPEEQLRKFFM